MKVFHISKGAKKTYKFDFAPLANGTDDSNWLDQTNSPVETISSYQITEDSPSVIQVVSHKKTDSNTSVAVHIHAIASGQGEVHCEITTTNSPAQEEIRTMRFIVHDTVG